MEDIIDITVPLTTDIPVWPGSRGIQITPVKKIEKGDSSNDSRVDFNLHTGTHIDAPRHFVQNGRTIEQLSLDIFVGSCFVVDMQDAADVTPENLSALNLPCDIKRLLIRTRNSELWGEHTSEFKKDFTAFTNEAAQWIVDKGIKLIGVDYLSVQRYSDGPETHQILLGADIVILEGLNLSNVQAGFYELICLPMKLVDTEAAPARVVLRRKSETYDEQSAVGGML